MQNVSFDKSKADLHIGLITKVLEGFEEENYI